MKKKSEKGRKDKKFLLMLILGLALLFMTVLSYFWESFRLVPPDNTIQTPEILFQVLNETEE